MSLVNKGESGIVQMSCVAKIDVLAIVLGTNIKSTFYFFELVLKLFKQIISKELACTGYACQNKTYSNVFVGTHEHKLDFLNLKSAVWAGACLYA